MRHRRPSKPKPHSVSASFRAAELRCAVELVAIAKRNPDAKTIMNRAAMGTLVDKITRMQERLAQQEAQLERRLAAQQLNELVDKLRLPEPEPEPEPLALPKRPAARRSS